MRRILPIVWAFCFSVFPVSADTPTPTPQQPGTKADTYVYTETIQVSDQAPDPHALKEVPAFITTIELDPEQPRMQTLPEVLSSSVGVTVKDFGGLGKLSTVSIRGSTSQQVLVLLDGIRINTASDTGVDLSTLPLNNIEKIEILRGADSAVFGDGAMGGVINLISRKSTAAAPTMISGKFSSGSFSTVDSTLSLQSHPGKSHLRFNGYYMGSDGDFSFRNNNSTPNNPDDDFQDVRRNNDIASGGGNLWMQFPLSSELTLAAILNGYYAHKGIPGMITFPSEHAEETDRRFMTTLRMELFRPDAAQSGFIEATAKWSGLDFDDPLGEQIGVPIHTRQRTRTIDTVASYHIAYTWGDGALTASYHGENLDDADFDSPTRDAWAISAKHNLKLFAESLWITSIVRFDDISDMGNRTSPKIGLRWFITPAFSIKANAGGAFRSPSFNELYMNMGYITGNPDLKPETSRSYDLGFCFETTRFRAELVGFRMDTDDLIQYLLVSGFRYKPFNIGKATSRGVESHFSWNIFSNLHVSSSYTYMKATDASSDRNYNGKTIPGRPKHELFSRIAWEDPRYSCFAEWRYTGGNYITRANTKILPVRRTANAGVTFWITDHLQAGVEVKNLTNEDVVDIRGFPLPGRTWFGSMHFTF